MRSIFAKKSTYSQLFLDFLHILNALLCTQSGSFLFVKNFSVDFTIRMLHFWMQILKHLDVGIAYINQNSTEAMMSVKQDKNDQIYG